MRRPVYVALIALGTLTAASCGSANPRPGSIDQPEQTTLVVENQSTLQVTIYVHRESQRQRLGVAPALSTTRLRIPDNIIFGPTPLRFEADPLGSRATPISEQITVSHGQEVRLRIPSTLR